MAEQKDASGPSAEVVGQVIVGGWKLKESEEQRDEFKKALESLVAMAITKKGDPFDLDSAIKYPTEQGLSEDAEDIANLKIANEFFKSNKLKIEQMMYCPLDQDKYDSTERQPRFRGLYPDFTLGLFCKDAKRKSWKFDIYFSHKQ